MSVTRRLISSDKLIIASHNPGKLKEIATLVAPFGIETTSALELGLIEPEETGVTFQENAELKARASSEASGLIALADDSGLMVDALGGDPGIYSARWAGPDKDFVHAMQKVESGLKEKGAITDDARRAHFVCVLCLAWPDGHIESFEGRISGALVWPPRGNKGFGYDPVFRPDGHEITFGEMDEDSKHAMSHRARAFAKMKQACLDK